MDKKPTWLTIKQSKYQLFSIVSKHNEMHDTICHFWIALNESQSCQNESRELPELSRESCQTESAELSKRVTRAARMSRESCQNESRQLPEWLTRAARMSHESCQFDSLELQTSVAIGSFQQRECKTCVGNFYALSNVCFFFVFVCNVLKHAKYG